MDYRLADVGEECSAHQWIDRISSSDEMISLESNRTIAISHCFQYIGITKLHSMRSLLFFSVLTLLITSCGSSNTSEKPDKKTLFGSFEGDYYKNPFFNFQVEFAPTWTVSDNPVKSVVFGGELFDGTYTLSADQEYPIRFSAEVDKCNPFEKASALKQLKESWEGYEMIYDAEDMVKLPFDITKIGGEDFVSSHITLADGADSSYIHEYCRVLKGYYLTITCVYNTKEDEEVALGMLKKFEKLK